jgi:uncharacterized protein (TIGR00251 family)
MYIKVKVAAGAKKEIVEKITEDSYKIAVKEPAEHNYANDRIVDIFRKFYPNTAVRIVSGHHSPSKIISIN